VSATRNRPPAPLGAIPELRFSVVGAQSEAHAAVPTLQFALQIEVPDRRRIRSVLLDVQIQIAARRRGYSEAAQERLLELFGAPDRWGTTLRTLPWTRVTVIVPPFEGATSIEVPVPCTYDLEVIASRYFAALDGGEVPLEFMFSGTVFFATPEGALQTARISWDQDVDYGLPVDIWKQAMNQHFPGTAWVRLGEESFARLCTYKARHAFTSWDAAVDALIGGEQPS
jgi:hypothetical protein